MISIETWIIVYILLGTSFLVLSSILAIYDDTPPQSGGGDKIMERIQEGLGKRELKEALWTNNGKKLSVQASRTHYSTPREMDAEHYSKVEVYTEHAPESWADYTSGNNTYAWLPVELVVEFIEANGGLSDRKDSFDDMQWTR